MSDYVHSGPSIRDMRSRIVSLEVEVSRLNMNEQAKDKLLRLVGDRYNQETDVLTLVADRFVDEVD
ncbi:MAG: hypothetical protein GY696_11690 [Gammaproteobacteria bacterium]|nr:hypothetical protein [Gammaproteobacteria bacterium]